MTDVPDFDNEGLGDLVPSRIPDWLVAAVRKSKGHDLSDFKGLNEYFNETQAIKNDRFDRSHYHRIRDEADELKELSQSRFTEDPTWAELIQDEFLGLYKVSPDQHKEKDMKATHKLNWSVFDKVMGLKDWDTLRTYTELDQWAASMAAVEFGLKLAELFDEMKELMEQQKKLNNEDQQIAGILERLKDPGTGIADAESLLDQLQEALDEYNEAAGGMENELQQHGGDIRRAAKQAAQEAREDAEGVSDMLESFGTEPGMLQRMPAEARMELARRIQRNRKLKELAEKVGRFVRLALGEQARKIVHGTDEVHDIVLGNDLNRVIASELSTLAHPVLKLDFYRKYAEHGLMQYELRGTEKVARGAIVCMIDSSGSMGGSKETWAKAVGIALLNIAAKQGRDFHGIIFGSSNEIKEFSFPKGKGSPSDVLDFAEFEFMGGTDFMTPISRGVEILRKQYTDEGSQKGDLVLITDGICDVTPDWRDKYFNAKEELAFRMYSCLIGVHADLLNVLSDQIYNITELAQGSDAREIFGYV
jgi:uncharacterized protein with von Willebrand factor type A (vWA) domain